VSFGYPGGPTLFRNLEFGIDTESRFAMVGPNGELGSAVLRPLTEADDSSLKLLIASFWEAHAAGVVEQSQPCRRQ